MSTATETAATIAELEAKLAIAADALQKLQLRATAGQLALEVMHEIKNPLEALGYLIYLASKDADDPEKVRANMESAREQMALLNHVASGTLAWAMKSTQPPEPIDLVAVAEAALRLHRRAIEAKQVRLVTRSSPPHHGGCL